MYRRQLLSTMSLLAICLALLGTGFFTLYYQYHLQELKESISKNVSYISDYMVFNLQNESAIMSEDFAQYLNSVALISNTSILLCNTDGQVIHASWSDWAHGRMRGAYAPLWAVKNAMNRAEFKGLTTLNGLLPNSSYVTGLPLVSHHLTLTPEGIVRSDVPIGLVFVAADATYVKDFLVSALHIFLVTAVVVLLLAMLLSAVTVQHIVQPLHAMSATVYRFARGDLDARITDYHKRNDEVGSLAKAFNAMAEALAEAEAKRSDFVANVSHELKTPMTTIAGFAEGILDGTIPPSRQRESLEIISSETRRLSRLTRRMLELSRLQSQERVSAQVQFDVAELLLRVLVSLEAKGMAKELEVILDLPEQGAMVWGEPDAITQVCYNLMDNAIKFSKEGGTLHLSLRSQAGKVYVSIGNEGETIPPEQLNRIFERFHKADRSRTEKDGVGLGLYIVKTILNTYNEDISVTSEDGKTTFTFTLSEV